MTTADLSFGFQGNTYSWQHQSHLAKTSLITSQQPRPLRHSIDAILHTKTYLTSAPRGGSHSLKPVQLPHIETLRRHDVTAMSTPLLTTTTHAATCDVDMSSYEEGFEEESNASTTADPTSLMTLTSGVCNADMPRVYEGGFEGEGDSSRADPSPQSSFDSCEEMEEEVVVVVDEDDEDSANAEDEAEEEEEEEEEEEDEEAMALGCCHEAEQDRQPLCPTPTQQIQSLTVSSQIDDLTRSSVLGSDTCTNFTVTHTMPQTRCDGEERAITSDNGRAAVNPNLNKASSEATRETSDVFSSNVNQNEVSKTPESVIASNENLNESAAATREVRSAFRPIVRPWLAEGCARPDGEDSRRKTAGTEAGGGFRAVGTVHTTTSSLSLLEAASESVLSSLDNNGHFRTKAALTALDGFHDNKAGVVSLGGARNTPTKVGLRAAQSNAGNVEAKASPRSLESARSLQTKARLQSLEGARPLPTKASLHSLDAISMLRRQSSAFRVACSNNNNNNIIDFNNNHNNNIKTSPNINTRRPGMSRPQQVAINNALASSRLEGGMGGGVGQPLPGSLSTWFAWLRSGGLPPHYGAGGGRGSQFHPGVLPHCQGVLPPCGAPPAPHPHSHPHPPQPPHQQQAPRYNCEACGKSYSTFGGLSKHKQFHCSAQIKKDFRCQYCEKTYSSLGALKMHIRTHTLPCKCSVCGKAFSRPWLLQGHLRTHTGEKPFSCQHCARAFADRSNLRAHLQTHSDVKKYSCRHCAKTFSRMSLLLKHRESSCVAQHR